MENQSRWLAGHDVAGIAFSGGGIRAASFALGVSQVLQKRRGLLRGDQAARWLTAVSGGSYIAGAITLINAGSRAHAIIENRPLGADDLDTDQSPYAPDSAEFKHLASHTRYLVEGGAVTALATISWAVLSGLMGAVLVVSGLTCVLLALSAFYGGEVVALAERTLDRSLTPPGDWATLIGIGAFFTFYVAATRPTDDRGRRSRWALAAIAVAALAITWSASSMFDYLRGAAHVQVPRWFATNSAPLLMVVVSILLTLGAVYLIGHVRRVRALRSLPLGVVGLAVRWLPVVATAWLGVWVATALPDWLAALDQVEVGAWQGYWFTFGVVLGAMALLAAVFGIPLHIPYRRRLASAFVAIRRNESVTSMPDSESVAMSSLVPGPFDAVEYRRLAREAEYRAYPGREGLAAVFGPRNDREESNDADPSWVPFPELIICAAANVREPGRTLAGIPAVPLTISGRTVSMPTSGATLPMIDVERRRVKHVGLAAAMAISGAAVSPSMGRKTIDHLRTLLLFLGIRLGAWLPNPMSENSQQEFRGKDPMPLVLPRLGGYLSELLGLHRIRWREIYASDGGHLDNLGLVELLRRRCAEVWVVDSAPDPRGECARIVQAMSFAQLELGCEFSLDLQQVQPTGNRHELGCTHLVGEVTFQDGHVTRMRIVKLGLHPDSSTFLRAYAATDRAFPFHSTLRQIYSADRFLAYVQLGQEAAKRLLAGLDSIDQPRV